MAHLSSVDGGLEGYRPSPTEAKKAFLEHLAELIAEEVMRGRGRESQEGEEQGQE